MFYDKEMICQECGGLFLFTAGEQGYYIDQGFLHEPVRCAGCREQRRRTKSRGRALTVVPCAECGTVAQVPFIPKQGRPVFCDTCYERLKEAVPAGVV